MRRRAGPENLDAKIALFAEMDKLADAETILASSTSFIMASRFTEGNEWAVVAASSRIPPTRRI